MRGILAAVVFLLCGATALAENPPDLSFVLAAKGGQTKFRMGEPILLELQFNSITPGLYELHNQPNIFISNFSTNPSDGVFPLPQRIGPGCCGGVGPPTPLGGKPGIILRELNTWLAFRTPGHYSITADYNGITLVTGKIIPKDNQLITVRSSALEIEIVNDPEWSQRELYKYVAVIEAPKTGGRSRSSTDSDGPNAAHSLGLLDTRESAMAIVSIYSRNIDPELRTHLDTGLRRSPYPKEVVAAMENALEAPDTPITGSFLDTLSYLMAVTTSTTPDFASSYLAVHEYLARAIPNKHGDALTVSRETLEAYDKSVRNRANR